MARRITLRLHLQQLAGCRRPTMTESRQMVPWRRANTLHPHMDRVSLFFHTRIIRYNWGGKVWDTLISKANRNCPISVLSLTMGSLYLTQWRLLGHFTLFFTLYRFNYANYVYPNPCIYHYPKCLFTGTCQTLDNFTGLVNSSNSQFHRAAHMPYHHNQV